MPKQWFVLRVQSNKEDKVKNSLVELIKARGLEKLVTNVLVPSEKVSEIKGGKKKITERKIYPGYIMAEVEVDEQGQSVFRGDLRDRRQPLFISKVEILTVRL